MRLHAKPAIVGLTLLLSAAATPSLAAILNGGFETPGLAPGGFQTITPGSEPVGFAWTVASGDVDLGNAPVVPFILYPAYEGVQALDLNGTMPGSIYQDFATVFGQQYELSFAFADNPNEGGVSSAAVNITDLTTTSILVNTTVSHSTSTNSPPFADWQISVNTFTAIGPVTRLSFTSTSASTSSSGGIVLDAVNVNPIPEPSTCALAAIAALSLLAFRRRQAAA
jgi:hypothetical protein